MITILIADDHTVVRQGLRHIISSSGDIRVGDEAADGVAVINCISRNTYDLVLLDISMPGRNGLDILKQIRLHNPKLPVLILSMHSEEDYAVRCLKAGAAGYLTKDSPAEEILLAIRKVAQGGRYLNQSLVDKIPFAWESPGKEPFHGQLSDREFQVMCMLAGGKTTTEIADELSLSLQTVSTYKARILEKMKMPSIAHVIRYAIEKGLVP
jgi:two-component system, NarL family, invasion response regulator UvrY